MQNQVKIFPLFPGIHNLFQRMVRQAQSIGHRPVRNLSVNDINPFGQSRVIQDGLAETFVGNLDGIFDGGIRKGNGRGPGGSPWHIGHGIIAVRVKSQAQEHEENHNILGGASAF
jgi:hypothetical protein